MGIDAKLVWDGGDVYIPEQMGTPRDDQMQGTPAEQLSEVSGRICYDSLGKGRPSFSQQNAAGEVEGYHDHILKVGHGSVLEHFHFTVHEPRGLDIYQMASLVGRPGVWLESGRTEGHRLTVNLRTVLDWDCFALRSLGHVSVQRLRDQLTKAAHTLAPHIVKQDPSVSVLPFVKPKSDEEKWISLYLSGSRGFSHEQVRHGDFTAISQRSTRYVDESETEWIDHPLLTKWLEDEVKNCGPGLPVLPLAEATAQRAYVEMVKELEPWLISRGVDKATARKQARGAARGYLGNALQTEMIFSASVGQWKRMLRQRACGAADAEIREVYEKVLPELQRSQYRDCFERFEQRPSPDGIGVIAVELDTGWH